MSQRPFVWRSGGISRQETEMFDDEYIYSRNRVDDGPGRVVQRFGQSRTRGTLATPEAGATNKFPRSAPSTPMATARR